MCRLVAAALVVCAFAAAPAGAATVGVYDGPDLSAVALAGPDAVVLRQASSERSQLVAVPRGGGKPQTVLTVERMNFVFEDESRRLAASAARVALIAEIEDAQDRTVEWRVYSGPPRGPIGVVRALPIREAWVPALVDVDGDRVLIVEARPESDGPIRAFLFDSAAGLVPIPWARASALPIEISGGFAAASMAGPNRVAVLDLATGAELVTVPLPDRERGADLSLAPDGRVAVATQAGVMVAGPGAAARLVPGTKGLKRVHLAGGTLSGIDKTGRAVALPVGGGRDHASGPADQRLRRRRGRRLGLRVDRERLRPRRRDPRLDRPDAFERPLPDHRDRVRLHRQHPASRPHHHRPGRLRHRTPRRVPRHRDRPHLRGRRQSRRQRALRDPGRQEPRGEAARDPGGARGVPPRGLREPRHGRAHPERAHRRGRGRQRGVGGRPAGPRCTARVRRAEP